MPNDVTADLIGATDIRKFFGHRPLYISDPDVIQVVKQTAKPQMFTIYGPDRLFWANVYEIEGENRFEAQLSTTPNPASVLCYWLPWRKDGMVRIRLRVSKKYGAPLTPVHMQAQKAAADSSIEPGAATGAVITRQAVDRTGGEEPRLFFTGMMDGCSTWIAGDPAEPVVYHINRISLHSKMKRKEDNYEFESRLNVLKTRKMTKDLKGLRKMEDEKDKREFVGVTPYDHSIHHYSAEQPEWLAQMQSHTKVTDEVKVLKQYISTSGVKSGAGWTFYAQDIYECKKYADTLGNTAGPKLYTAGKPQKRFPL